jgi:hypothetical protein
MNKSADPSTLAPAKRNTSQSSIALFGVALRQRPLFTSLYLVVEYAMFAAAVSLALGLFLTRGPLRFVDGVFGLRLRERFIDLIARLSPG